MQLSFEIEVEGCQCANKRAEKENSWFRRQAFKLLEGPASLWQERCLSLYSLSRAPLHSDPVHRDRDVLSPFHQMFKNWNWTFSPHILSGTCVAFRSITSGCIFPYVVPLLILINFPFDTSRPISQWTIPWLCSFPAFDFDSQYKDILLCNVKLHSTGIQHRWRNMLDMCTLAKWSAVGGTLGVALVTNIMYDCTY